jgi:murein DD-endopeptidase MepM/ murein hydrolase activator NlpD
MNIAIRLPYDGDYPLTQCFGENPQIYSRFGKPGHNGIDIGLPTGTPVLAAADGKVARIGNDPNGYGKYILLQHSGFQTLYAHLQEFQVAFMDAIRAGNTIALSNNTGFSTGPHLHFELRIPGFPGAYSAGEVDPQQFVRAIEAPTYANTEYQDDKDQPSKGVVLVNKLNIREQPNTNATIVDFYTKGDEVTILERKIVEEWVRTKKGWCARHYSGEKHIDER